MPLPEGINDRAQLDRIRELRIVTFSHRISMQCIDVRYRDISTQKAMFEEDVRAILRASKALDMTLNLSTAAYQLSQVMLAAGHTSRGIAYSLMCLAFPAYLSEADKAELKQSRSKRQWGVRFHFRTGD